MKLTSQAVDDIMKDVLFKEEEKDDAPKMALHVDGLVRRFGFHPQRVQEAKPRIDALLDELHDDFKEGGGGGYSFLNVPFDKNGRQWGEHREAEALVCLGIAVGSAEWMLREIAQAMPGGVPYVLVHTGRVS